MNVIFLVVYIIYTVDTRLSGTTLIFVILAF